MSEYLLDRVYSIVRKALGDKLPFGCTLFLVNQNKFVVQGRHENIVITIEKNDGKF